MNNKLSKVFNEAKKELEALKDLEGLKEFFHENSGKVFNKRITDQLPDYVTIKLEQHHDGSRLHVRIYQFKNQESYYGSQNSFEYWIYHTGYGKDLGIHPLDESKRINAENIALIIDHVIDNKTKHKTKILETDLQALSKALYDLHKAEKALQKFNYTLLADGLEFWPDGYKTERAIRHLEEHQNGK